MQALINSAQILSLYRLALGQPNQEYIIDLFKDFDIEDIKKKIREIEKELAKLKYNQEEKKVINFIYKETILPRIYIYNSHQGEK